jgi:transcriptional regulator with XRE-family HTH domain
MVRDRRKQRTLREVSKEIGVSAATLLRVEAGRIPDVETFGKLCRWLQLDPKVFLGGADLGQSADSEIRVSAHFRAEREPQPATMAALAQMLLFAAKSQKPNEPSEPDEPPAPGI